MAKNKPKRVEPKEKRLYVLQSDVPATGLDDALRISQALIENYAGKPATPLQVASALEMSPTAGPFRSLCGSSIAYGLTSGGYNAKEISVEPLAKRILESDSEGGDIAAKREAALKPRVLNEFVRKYDNSPLPRPEIAVGVLAEMGIPKDRAAAVYSLILNTVETLGLVREIKGKKYVDLSGVVITTKPEIETEDEHADPASPLTQTSLPIGQAASTPANKELGQAIFVAHGRNKKPLEQLKRILDQFKIPYKVATEEPNLGRPIGGKVKEIMESCNCAILIFTADEEFKTKDGQSIWRPSENVVYELGASGYLYGSRIVILKEEGIEFAANFRDLGYISFSKDLLEAKSMDVLKELIGFGIVRVST